MAEQWNLTSRFQSSFPDLIMTENKLTKRAHRKDEHLRLAKANFQIEKVNSFDSMKLLRLALPETKISLNSIETTFLGHYVSAPFFINAITGGSPLGTKINEALGQVANQNNIPLALGSASIVGHEPESLQSFLVAREQNPTGIILANINPSTDIAVAKFLERELRPQAIQIHLNAVQELVMPEGDSDFRWLQKLINLREAITVPVIIKEVGFGFDLPSLKLLEQNNFQYVDVAGAGGTDFAWIENFRRPGRDMSYMNDVGISTVDSLLNAQKTSLTYFASGGVRNPLDILKSLVLGAKSVGISNRFLQEYNESGVAGLNNLIEEFKEQLAGLLAIYGVDSLASVNQVKFEYHK